MNPVAVGSTIYVWSWGEARDWERRETVKERGREMISREGSSPEREKFKGEGAPRKVEETTTGANAGRSIRNKKEI